jgi:two-component system sensor histidine kinase UhpB
VIFAAFGAALPTLLLSFADAAISVATAWSASFDAAFITRVRSNVLTHLIVVPALIDASALHWRRLRTRRLIEGMALTLMVIVTCTAAFGRPAASGAFPALLYAPLPLLLWAAVRFGPGGTGWSLLLVATVASWVALRVGGSFATRSPLDAVVSLQLFLLASATPLLFLSAVIRERDGAQAALRGSYARARMLAARLIGAQEAERSRVARDMHDDFNQQLAALSISISAVRQRVSPAQVELQDELRTLQARTVALTDQVRRFSHDLHPGTLDHVGLTSALRAYCNQVAEQQGLPLSFQSDDNLGWIPRDVAVCIYRIVQEGLRNIVKHADAPAASVSLARSTARIELSISDHGRGFEPGTAFARGLGLLSIEERARLVGGSLTIVSGPGQGTRLDVHIPVTPAWNAAVPVTHA